MPMHRIYFDTNDGAEDGRYGLWVRGSLKDITPIADQLYDGLRVIIYMTGEVEMEAVLRYDSDRSAWTAIPDASTLRYLDGSDAPLDRPSGRGHTLTPWILLRSRLC